MKCEEDPDFPSRGYRCFEMSYFPIWAVGSWREWVEANAFDLDVDFYDNGMVEAT